MNDKKVIAFYNWNSKWTGECPVCGHGAYESVAPGKPFICSRCYPGINATMLTMGENSRVISVPDMAARDMAYEKAVRENGLFDVVFPKNMEKIMAELRKRPMKNMNWYPGETLEDIIKENKEHGI
jgi:hypothetical protein